MYHQRCSTIVLKSKFNIYPSAYSSLPPFLFTYELLRCYPYESRDKMIQWSSQGRPFYSVVSDLMKCGWLHQPSLSIVNLSQQLTASTITFHSEPILSKFWVPNSYLMLLHSWTSGSRFNMDFKLCVLRHTANVRLTFAVGVCRLAVYRLRGYSAITPTFDPRDPFILLVRM